MDDSENRDRERVPILGHLRGEVMVFQHMTILDISNGGAQIETAFPLLLDSLHEFRLTLGDLSVEAFGVKHEWELVNAANVDRGDHAVDRHVRK